METKFYIFDTKKTIGSAGKCPIGSTLNPRMTEATITIGAYGMPMNRIHINHLILREALLNSPEVLKEMGIKVTDLLAKSPTAKQSKSKEV